MLLPLPQNTSSVYDHTSSPHDILDHEEGSPCPASLQQLNVALLPWKGRSDPFSALAIRVCARTNAILTFGRDVYNPAMLPQNLPTKITNCHWQGIVSRIQSEGSAYGVVCFYAIAMSLVTPCPTWSRMALRYQVKCMAYLRPRLLQARVEDYPDIITQIVSLCACENMTGQVGAAKAHCNVLKVLFEVCDKNGLVDGLTLRVSLDFDTGLSARHLIRTSFDVDGWVPKTVAKFFEETLQSVPHLFERPNTPLDSCIGKASPLLLIMSDLRDHYHAIHRISQLWSEDDPRDMLMTYLTMRSTYLEGRLVNYYVDLGESQKHPEDIWPQAYICLATLYMSLTIVHVPIINGVRLNESSSNIRKHLQKAIIEADQSSDLVCKRRYSNALLWALFVSASAERLGTTESVDYWFETNFREQMLRMGLTKWPDVQKILRGFPRVPEVLGQDSGWVEKLLKFSTVYDEDGKLAGRGELKWV